MIAKISHGWRPHGLLHYLLGPGRYNEHRDPRVIGTWDGAPELHQPPRFRRGGQEWAEVGELAADLSDPAVAAGIRLREPLLATVSGGKLRRGPVWHCSLRNSPEDRVLSDAEWVEVIEDLLDRNGMAPRGDDGACRWVAVRHAEDHVHVAVLRVRQDNGRKVSFSNDRFRARETCIAAEQRFGLRGTSPADRTGAHQPTRAELEKATRREVGEPSRVWLRRAVRVAAVQARNPEEFFARLTDLGVRYRVRESSSGQLVGYSVADPDDVDASGEPIWFGARRSLARDLAMPQLLKRWESAAPPAARIPPAPSERAMIGREERRAALQEAAVAARDAAAVVRSGGPGAAGAGTVAAIGHAAGDLFTAVGALTHTGRPLTRWEPAELFDRASREPGVGQPAPNPWPEVAARLRTAAWRLIGLRTLSGRDEGGHGELLIALGALLAELAAWHVARRQNVHAAAAAGAGEALQRAPAPTRADGQAQRGAGATPSVPGRVGVATATPVRRGDEPRRGRARPPGGAGTGPNR